MSGTVVAVVRHPLKSARGEQVPGARVEAAGLQGDRAWACLDLTDGTVGSAKSPRRWGALLQVRARTDGDEVVLDVAGQQAPAGSGRADAALSDLLGRSVRLTREVPEDARLHRRLPDEPGLRGDWVAAAPGDELVTPVTGARPGGRFVDAAPLHLVTTGALARLAAELGRRDVPAARFRANLVLDLPDDPPQGALLHTGDVVLRVGLPTPRCAVPGVDDDGRTDGDLLRRLAHAYRRQVGDLGRAACFGAYAQVLRPGDVAAGDAVEVELPG